MAWYDVTGRKVNIWDRFTRNLVIVLCILMFGARMFIGYFVKPVYPEDTQAESLTLCLVGVINLIFGYFLGRNQNQVEEKKEG